MTFLDYSEVRPSGTTIRADGYTGVIRYIGEGSAGKRLTAAEYRDLVGAGLQVWFVVELGVHDVSGEYAAGQTRGRDALADLQALGITDTTSPIFCCMDEHVTKVDTSADAVAYAQGFASVVGKGRAGFYGFGDSLGAVHGADVVSAYWLCGTKPGAAVAAWIHLWQDNTSFVSVGGVQCDIDHIYQPWTAAKGVDDLATVDQSDWDNVVDLLLGKVSWLVEALMNGDTALQGGPAKGAPVAVVARQLAVQGAVAKIPTTLPTLTLTADQIPALAAAVAERIAPLSAADRTAIATATADVLAARLSA